VKENAELSLKNNTDFLAIILRPDLRDNLLIPE
jgi:hypothetical protein